eukprot:4042084-Alexandrium_andersonii.AAC.1
MCVLKAASRSRISVAENMSIACCCCPVGNARSLRLRSRVQQTRAVCPTASGRGNGAFLQSAS